MTQLFGLLVLSAIAVAIAFLVVAMADGLESRTKPDFEFDSSINVTSDENGIGVPSRFKLAGLSVAPSGMDGN